MAPRNGKQEWEVVCDLATALGYPMHYGSSSEIMDEIAAMTPTFAGVSFAKLDEVGSVQWPCNDAAPLGTPDHARRQVRPGQGALRRDPVRPHRGADEPALSRSSSRPGASCPSTTSAPRRDEPRTSPGTRRTCSRSTPIDAEERGVVEVDWVALASRVGETTLRAHITDRVPQGVVYTTFHHPVTGANVVTTEYSDWATNCPEYKVTAVQVRARVQARVGPQSPGLRSDRTASGVPALR